MTKRDKRIQRIRQNPKNVSFDELRQVLEDHGFALARVTGSHHIFVVEIGVRSWKLTIPYNKPVKSIYVKTALEAIDEINALQNEAVVDEGDSDGNDES